MAQLRLGSSNHTGVKLKQHIDDEDIRNKIWHAIEAYNLETHFLRGELVRGTADLIVRKGRRNMRMQKTGEVSSADFQQYEYDQFELTEEYWRIQTGISEVAWLHMQRVGNSGEIERNVAEALLAAERNEEAVIVKTATQATTGATLADGAGFYTANTDVPDFGSHQHFGTAHTHTVAVTTGIDLPDLNAARKHLAHHGYRGARMYVNEDTIEELANLAPWTTVLTPNSVAASVDASGTVGQIHGWQVATSPYIPTDTAIFADTAERPISMFELLPVRLKENPNQPNGLFGSLIEHFYGMLVTSRGAGYVLQFNDADTTYTVPTIPEAD